MTGAAVAYITLPDPQTVVVPAAAFIAWDRLPGGVVPEGYIPIPPDLAAEVASPSDEPGDIAQKRDLYRRAGVPLAWWVDAKRRAVAVYRIGRLVAELAEDGELDGDDVLPGVRLPITQVFSVL